MKRFPVRALLTGLCVLAIAAGTSFAQERDKPARDAQRTGDRAQAGNLDAKTTGATIRASQLIGMNIQNEQGESLGEIEDLVLDAGHGEIRYAAVTCGGFLGLGDKMFAVPWQAFKFRQDRDDRDEYVLVLNVTQQMLDGAQGFDQDHWPNFADQKFVSELHKRYKVEQRTGSRNRDVDVDVEVDREPQRDR